MGETSKEVHQYPNINEDLPNFINEEGTRFWIHGELYRIAKKRKINMIVIIAQRQDGLMSILLQREDGSIEYESQKPEAIECHIEWLAMVNR